VYDAGVAAPDRPRRDAANTLGRQFRTTVLRRSLDGARHTLDALLVAAHDGHPPGTRIRMLTGPHRGQAATIIGTQWATTGAPHAYQIRIDNGPTILTASVDNIDVLDQPTQPEPVLP
jgi:hypothetical protein